MDTKKKGDIFENFVFDYFSALIQKGYMGLNPSHTKIYKQKKYFSKDREDYITFDVAIEVFLFDQKEPYLVILIECKNYEKMFQWTILKSFQPKLVKSENIIQRLSALLKTAFRKEH